MEIGLGLGSVAGFSRYGPSEVLGTIAAVTAAVAVQSVTGSIVAGAYAGTLAEATGFYGPVLSIYEWRIARGAGRPVDRGRRTTATNLEREE